MSDHFANFMILHSKNKAFDRPMVRIFSDKNKATNLLTKINWENELSDKNANEAMNIFNKKTYNSLQ